MSEGEGERELRPVRDAEERDLVETERLADRLQVLRVNPGAVVVARRPDLVRAGRRGGALRVGGDRALQLGAVDYIPKDSFAEENLVEALRQLGVL